MYITFIWNLSFSVCVCVFSIRYQLTSNYFVSKHAHTSKQYWCTVRSIATFEAVSDVTFQACTRNVNEQILCICTCLDLVWSLCTRDAVFIVWHECMTTQQCVYITLYCTFSSSSSSSSSSSRSHYRSRSQR